MTIRRTALGLIFLGSLGASTFLYGPAVAQLIAGRYEVLGLLGIGAVLFVAHVGDSRCYLGRAGVLHQLTRDDTVVQALLEKGVDDGSAG
jgi:serine/threonine protein phosphatase PrpC